MKSSKHPLRKSDLEQKSAGANAATALPAGYVLHGGLIWMPVTFVDTWTGANACCMAFNGLGKTGWRMPTLAELSALRRSSALNGQGWILGAAWSSSALGVGRHFRFNLINGVAHWDDDALHNWVACVRKNP